MGDLIDRQAAIEVVDAVWSVTGDKNVAKVWDQIKDLPSAEKPFKLPEIYVAEGFDTVEDEDGNIGFGVYVPAENKIYVAGDVEDEIRARALLHEVCHWVQDMCGRPFDEDEANEFSDIVYDALPSAQPEQRWIPCSEKLPENGHYYLWCSDGGNVQSDYYWDGFENGKKFGYNIIAWMPLPEPYKEEQE